MWIKNVINVVLVHSKIIVVTESYQATTIVVSFDYKLYKNGVLEIENFPEITVISLILLFSNRMRNFLF